MRISSPFVRACVRIGVFGLLILLLVACGSGGSANGSTSSRGGTSVPPTTPTSTPTSVPTTAPTTPPVATAQPVGTVATGMITENLLLTCGTNCNDPIRVTITTVQVNDADGNMVWNISLEDITGTGVGYGVDTFELLASGSQTQIPATVSQSSGSLTNNVPLTIQATFAFVPIQSTTYTLTVVVQENPFEGPQITFVPAQITNL